MSAKGWRRASWAPLLIASCTNGGHTAHAPALVEPDILAVAHPPAETPEAAALAAAQRAVQRATEAENRGAQRAQRCVAWPLWRRYASSFVQGDGRVVDPVDGRSTSEGQAYALFFALVGRDRARFERLLAWTDDNLADGALGERLPAWLWGKREDGSWGVRDRNSASDADLWLIYTLLEAEGRFREPRYRALAEKLAATLVEREVVSVAGLGPVLLPGPEGFQLAKGKVRLNPSYLVLPLFRRLAGSGIAGPWQELLESSVKILVGSAPFGLAPDWVAYSPGAGFEDDPVTGPLGSYDAIRVYLWASMSSEHEADGRALRSAAFGLYDIIKRLGRVPERIQVRTGDASENEGPPGFVAVALAQAHARGDAELARVLRARLEATARRGLFGDPPAYYDQNLAMFALGFLDGRYAFGADGRLHLPWDEVSCET